MNSASAQVADLNSMVASPVCWGVFVAAIGLWAMLSGQRATGAVFGTVGLAVLVVGLPKFGAWDQQILFWLLAATAVMASAAAISAHNPVYTAIWFALSLLGVAGLFLLRNAQFLGVATIMVYAGAIVVTFLFVLMLAQPEGKAYYDRISWARFSVPLSVSAAAMLVVLVAWSFESSPPSPARGSGNLASDQHVALLGTELFARHLVAVELAGTILLVALVGAIAIVIHGKQQPSAASVLSAAGRGDS